jgi:hypothetical protein
MDDYKNQIYFSKMNSDLEGSYVEITNMSDVKELLEKVLLKYNDSNERAQMTLYIFSELIITYLKIIRVMQTSGGHLMFIALKGSGVGNL